MSKLNRYVFRELAVVGVFSFVTLTFVAAGGAIVQLFREYPSQGLMFVLSAAPGLVAYVAPHTLGIAVALAGTLVFGRLSGDRELEAVRTSGVPVTRLLTAVVLLGLLASGLAGALRLVWTPSAYRARKHIAEKSVMAVLKKPPPGVRVHRFGSKYLLRYENAIGSRLEQPYIVEIRNVGALPYMKAYYIAEAADITFNAEDVPVLTLKNCRYGVFKVKQVGDRVDVETESEGSADVLPWPMDLPRSRGYHEDLEGKTMPELLEEVRLARGEPREAEALTEFHSRIAGGIAPLPLLLLAAAIGMTVRQATRLAGLGATLPSIILFEGMDLIFGKMGDDGRLPPLVAAYLGVAVMTLAAAALIAWRTRR